MTPEEHPWIDPRAIDRFRVAGRSIRWQERSWESSDRHRVRIATLREESARVEEWGSVSGRELVVDSSPVGALILALEVDRDGPPAEIGPVDGGALPGFPDGALRAEWRTVAARSQTPPPTWKEIVGLARYALR